MSTTGWPAPEVSTCNDSAAASATLKLWTSTVSANSATARSQTIFPPGSMWNVETYPWTPTPLQPHVRGTTVRAQGRTPRGPRNRHVRRVPGGVAPVGAIGPKQRERDLCDALAGPLRGRADAGGAAAATRGRAN